MPELEDIFGGTPTDTTATQDPPETPPPSDPPPAAAAAPPEPAQPSFSTSGLYARAQAAGLPLDGIDNEGSFAEALLDRYMQDRAYADLGRSSLATPSGKTSPKPDEEEESAEDDDLDEFDPESHFSSLWKTPSVSDQSKFLISQGIVEIGENGLYQAKPGFETMALPALNEINQAHVAQKEQWQKLVEGNPVRFMYDGMMPAMKHEFQKMLREHVGQQFQSYEQQTQAQTFEQKFTEQHKSWLYQPDGRLTADGEKFRTTVQELRDQGITDHQRLADYALKLSGVNTTPAPAVPNTSAAPAVVGRQRDEHGQFVKGTDAPPAAPAKTKQESFIDDMRRKAGASSNQGSYTDNPGEFVPSNEGELENMFTNAYRIHKTGAAA